MVDVGGSSPHIYMCVLTKHIMTHSVGTIVNLAIATLLVICHSEHPLARAKWLVFTRKGTLQVLVKSCCWKWFALFCTTPGGFLHCECLINTIRIVGTTAERH